MDYAVDLITGETISAMQALAYRDDARNNHIPGYLCKSCGDFAFLRRNGRGEAPFFCHFQHSPSSCPLRTGSAKWSSTKESEADATDSLIATLRSLLVDVEPTFFAQLDPLSTDSSVAKFLSAGIILTASGSEASDTDAAIERNLLRLLYKPRLALLLRWACAAALEIDPSLSETSSDEFARHVRQLCLKLLHPATQRVRDRSDFAPADTPFGSISPGRSISMQYTQDGTSNCFTTNGARTELIEIELNSKIRLYSDAPVTLCIIRHPRNVSRHHEPTPIQINPAGHHIHVAEPEGIIIAPNYKLPQALSRRPLLYIVPQRTEAAPHHKPIPSRFSHASVIRRPRSDSRPK
jgi:hypothetical protein